MLQPVFAASALAEMENDALYRLPETAVKVIEAPVMSTMVVMPV